MKFNVAITFSLSLLLIISSNWSVAKESPPLTTIEGLELIKDSELALVYADPDADLGHATSGRR